MTYMEALTPIDVLKLFEQIPIEDIPLLAMDATKYKLVINLFM